ncbi:MAG: FtsB family cell division protein [Luteolibacter sp.]
MASKRYTPQKLARIETTTKVVQGFNKVLCLCMAIAFGLLVYATAIPQKKELSKLQSKLENIQATEQITIARKENQEIQLHALREDNTYLEVQARDRLNYYKPGERILRFDRNQ